jgi:AraC-like DNA-binding protein
MPPTDPSAHDFASAALVTLVQRALAEAGLAVSVPAARPGALVPLSSKRDLLAAVADEHGLRPLIQAGRHLTRTPPDPAGAALLAAADPADLFARWSRLERFVHSRHRVLVRASGERHLVAEHVSTTNEPPRAFEDVLILGVLAAALAAIGSEGLTVRLGADLAAPTIIDGDLVHEPGVGLSTALWRYDWRTVVRSAKTPEPTVARDATAAVRAIVAADPARGWTVAAAAAALTMSTRSLQRMLEPSGGLSTVVGAARAERAAHFLIGTEHPLSLVGFACGYADQPHFTREFRRRTALTPAAYRRAFAHGRGDPR